jgi:hypothetical protein
LIVLEGAAEPASASDAEVRSALRDALDSGLSVRDAAASVSDVFDIAHREAYSLALEVRQGQRD